MLLVFAAYVPKTHDLAELGRRCARACPGLGPIIPHDAPDRARLAALLRAAYIDARYSFGFDVPREELEYLPATSAHSTRTPSMPAGCESYPWP